MDGEKIVGCSFIVVLCFVLIWYFFGFGLMVTLLSVIVFFGARYFIAERKYDKVKELITTRADDQIDSNHFLQAVDFLNREGFSKYLSTNKDTMKKIKGYLFEISEKISKIPASSFLNDTNEVIDIVDELYQSSVRLQEDISKLIKGGKVKYRTIGAIKDLILKTLRQHDDAFCTLSKKMYKISPTLRAMEDALDIKGLSHKSTTHNHGMIEGRQMSVKIILEKEVSQIMSLIHETEHLFDKL